MDKEEQKRLITEIMNEDAKDGLYDDSPVWIYKPNLEKFKKLRELHAEAKQQAEKNWERCDGCDENDKNFFGH